MSGDKDMARRSDRALVASLPEPVVSAHSGDGPSRDDCLDDDELCDCCGEPWEQCRNFFEDWICGMMPDGYCSLAGTEECDFECRRHA